MESGKKFGYVNFDDGNLEELTRKDLNTVLEAAYRSMDMYFHKDGQEVEFAVVEKNRMLEMISHLRLPPSDTCGHRPSLTCGVPTSLKPASHAPAISSSLAALRLALL